MNRTFHGCGAAYDPVFWPREMWPVHVDQMRECGLRFVRLFEFCWSSFEPKEGSYDFSWADDVLGLLDDAGIRYLLCTPGATPPVWLTARYPEAVIVHVDGSRDLCEQRRHGCPSCDVYMDRLLALTREMAERYGRRNALMGWQIDNELGAPECYCSLCEAAFRAWLQERFCSIEEANHGLGLRAWGREWTSWEHVRLPRTGPPQARLAFRKWMSRKWIDYVQKHVKALRPHTDAPVTTNMMVPWHGYDHFEMASCLDLIGVDAYPYTPETAVFNYSGANMDFAYAYARAMAGGEAFWVTETSALMRFRGQPPPGRVEEWTRRQIAHGANAVCYFRFDTAPCGREAFTRGIVGPGTWKGPAFDEVKQTCTRVGSLATKLDGTRPARSDVALVFSYPAWWMHLEHPLCKDLIEDPVHGYPLLLRRHGDGLHSNGIAYDFVGPTQDWSAYRCIVMPHCLIVDRPLADRCEEYVRAGGILVATCLTGLCDADGIAHAAPYPASPLGELLGVAGPGGGPIAPDAGEVTLPVNDQSLHPQHWIEQVQPLSDDVEVWLRYEHTFYARFPALTCRKVGKGRALYLGTALASEEMPRFWSWLLTALELGAATALPPGVWMRTRIADSGREVRFYQNAGEQGVTFEADGQPLEVGARGCVVVERAG